MSASGGQSFQRLGGQKRKMAVEKIENEIIALISKAVNSLIAREIIPLNSTPDVELESPKDEALGDLSTNVALKIARKLKIPSGKAVKPSVDINSLKIAELIAGEIKTRFKKTPLLANKIKKIEVKFPGFINFFLNIRYLYGNLVRIKKLRQNYGCSNIGRKQKIQIEFVSANPTGPLTIAHGRQAAVGDVLANILKTSGYNVKKEYYINDVGTQIDLLGRSVRVRYLELFNQECLFPENGYKGRYIYDIAQEIARRYGRRYLNIPEERCLNLFSKYAVRTILKGIKNDLGKFGVHFNRWFSQGLLISPDKINKTLRILKKKNHIYEKDGAVWLRSSSFGDDKDRVVIKTDGSFTYISSDIAYHRNKYRRGFKRIIDIWGPDHHGYAPRLKMAAQALGYPARSLSILFIQLVSLYENGKVLSMSTREGEFVTLNQLVEEVGVAAARFFFLMRRRDSHLDFDLNLAKKHSEENPVYYVQYAHARICSIIQFARARSRWLFVVPQRKRDMKDGLLFLLDKPEEISMIKILRRYPEVVVKSAEFLEPHQLTIYLRNLATSFHHFYTKHRVVTDNPRLTAARLLLVDCVKIVLRNGLNLLGIVAPEKM